MVNTNLCLFMLKQKFDVYWTGAFRVDPVKSSWSQFGEDEILCKELSDVLESGFYLDIGANHPTKLSNTFKLYRLGMRGITVEPNAALSQLHARYRPNDIQLCAASGERDGLATFYLMDSHPLSTFSLETCQSLIAQGFTVLSRSLMPVFTTQTILRDCAMPERPIFALLSIDTESLDEMVLRSNDWSTYRPRIIVFEDYEGTNTMVHYLKDFGYESIASRGCNHILRLKS
jgi:FkbM family methyltransferase